MVFNSASAIWLAGFHWTLQSNDMLENNPTLTSAEGFYGLSDIKARNVQFHQKARFSFDVIIVIFGPLTAMVHIDCTCAKNMPWLFTFQLGIFKCVILW